ncbi:AAA family ATPase [Streptomyces sp. LBUM 1476]|nr:AAA family ATPase [Streptomyces sp. LBUM 1476]
MWDCRLIVVAVPDPRDEAFTADIAVQVEVVKGWWAGEELGERRYEVAESGELSALRDLEDFLREQEVVSAHRRQVLVVYITGHGVNPGSDEHYLLMPETDSGKLLNTAFQTSELITSVLESDVEHALVMVDSCRSGVLRVELPRLVRALSEERRSLTSRVVLTVGGENDRPRPKAFSNLLAAMAVYLREESSGYASSHLSFQDFHALMGESQQNSAAPDIHLVWPEHKVSRANSQHLPTPCLPNPGYRPTPDLTAVSEVPPHFTGRTAERDRITEFLRSGTTALVVTGVTGSGKSALLNWTATQGIDAAVLARDAEPDQLARALAGVPESDGDALDHLLDHIHDSVRRERRPLTVLIDGIDEAKNPTSVVTNLIGLLAQQRTDDGRPAVRMVLGVRSPRPDGPGAGRQPGLLDLLVTVTSACPPLRTDDTAAVQADIEHYARARLPGASDLARAIAERVTPSFLDARIAVDDLLSHGEPADAAWLDTLGQGTGELLRQEIRKEAARGGFPAEHIGYALSATAFAQGAGLPWRTYGGARSKHWRGKRCPASTR